MDALKATLAAKGKNKSKAAKKGKGRLKSVSS